MNKSFEIGTLLLRVITGIIFFVHGLSKFQGMEATIQFFGSIGLPSFMAYVIAAIELVGGVLVFFGLATRIVGVLFALTLIGAIITVKLKAPFMGNA
ncbi:DoxX family oxidoreductase CatD, partial [Xanthomonas citri pv. citri]|nr:DoxX family oxidoreductase CatD [Xanthomonas citri pv. citri]